MHTAADPKPRQAFRPSEYTAALLGAMRRRPDLAEGASVLDVGCGSGVLLAAAGALGARHLCGVDREAEAVEETLRLLRAVGLGDRREAHRGHLFDPVRGRAFDLVVANLPHFPMEAVPHGDRRPSWSGGGADGRALMDPFLSGLSAHLAPGGQALLVHNAFIGIEATRLILAGEGLEARVVDTVVVSVPQEKVALMTPDVLARESGRTIHRIGPHTFAEVLVLAIGRGAGKSPAAS